MRTFFALASFVFVLHINSPAWAQTEDEPVTIAESGLAQPESLEKTMAAIAQNLLSRTGMENKNWDANQLFRMQLLNAEPEQARRSILAWRTQAQIAGQAGSDSLFVVYELYALSLELQNRHKLSFETAYQQAFRQIFAGLNDKAAYDAAFSLGASVERLKADFEQSLKIHAGKKALRAREALTLSRQYLAWQVYEKVIPLSAALLREDDERRYQEEQLLIPTIDGAQISTLVIRPRQPVPGPEAKKYASLFSFTIYANDDWARADARKMAANGYVGVVSYSRGKGRSPDQIIPYEHDGDDARTVINWIASQNWSDGRVGMYGGSYSAFTQWATAKKLPPALKAMATSASAAPGIDIPAEGNVFMNFMYSWLPYVTNNKTLDDATYGDKQRWQKLDKTWYLQGSAYRELDKIDGTPSPVHRRWLQHPGYDNYWQALIPYRQEFAAINIPILGTTGYFDGGQVGVLHYFQQHTRYLPNADHTLLIGPFSHLAMQTGVSPYESGYKVDEVARLDLQALRLQWFDHLFKGTPKPSLLKDRVNYQVMGANLWKHAPTLAAMQPGHADYYLATPTQEENEQGNKQQNQQTALFRLTPAPALKQPPISLMVNMANRDDATEEPGEELRVNKTLNTRNALAFFSDTMPEAMEISGLFAGHLEFTVNKKDVDLTVTLYEQMPDGRYFELASYMTRASYARDRSKRSLLQAGKKQIIDFTAERITSRQMQAGSKIVVAIGIPKQQDLQINYGTGKDVSDETIADAGKPFQLQLLNSTYIRVPLGLPGK
ncbi:CocE/NonD family hydrolase [Undibacterium sp. TS12]|uniref:CocE/NonD family hydrolase n=1 Tax=Undibacterium sp. TS12 TaxID=2908202 RepID=UPI001F4C7E32|nr:CocE/NonD family hydrolase [Undibacterium sp. TS12]MCH8619781.1 CocE/NonD family hydrolase [Undibacterium sp. TS12]